jgi:hypothetical protein
MSEIMKVIVTGVIAGAVGAFIGICASVGRTPTTEAPATETKPA